MTVHWILVWLSEITSSDKHCHASLLTKSSGKSTFKYSSVLLSLMSFSELKPNEHLFSLIYLLLHFISRPIHPDNQFAISEAWLTESSSCLSHFHDTCMFTAAVWRIVLLFQIKFDRVHFKQRFLLHQRLTKKLQNLFHHDLNIIK